MNNWVNNEKLSKKTIYTEPSGADIGNVLTWNSQEVVSGGYWLNYFQPFNGSSFQSGQSLYIFFYLEQKRLSFMIKASAKKDLCSVFSC